MVAAAEIAAGRGLLTRKEVNVWQGSLKMPGFLQLLPYSADEIIPLLSRDKKAQYGRPRFVLPLGLGKAALFDDVGRR